MDDHFIGIDIDIEPPSSSSSNDNKRSKKTIKKHNPPPITTNATKQKRKKSNKKLIKPKPPPNPPSSLIKLLQNDKSVHNYFQSLTSNLNYDVMKWKVEAEYWKGIATTAASNNNDAATKVITTNNVIETANITDAGGRKKRKASSQQQKHNTKNVKSKVIKQPKGSNNHTKKLQQQVEQQDYTSIPITDEILFGDLSDDEDDDKSCCQSTNELQQQGASNTKDNPNKRRRRYKLNKLKEAQRLLDYIGVSLVTIEKIVTTAKINSSTKYDTPKTATADTNENDIEEQEERIIIHRQSDEKVISDLLSVLRTCIKSPFIAFTHQMNTDIEEEESCIGKEDREEDKKRLSRYYHPFCKYGMVHIPQVYFTSSSSKKQPTPIPAVAGEANSEEEEHPASIVLRCILSILIIFENHCCCGDDNLLHNDENDEWDAIFVTNEQTTTPSANNKAGETVTTTTAAEEEELAIIQTGMKHRYELTKRFISSLHLEISNYWSIMDYNANNSLSTSDTLYFHPSDVLDIDTNTNDNKDDNSTSMYSTKSYNRLILLEERISYVRLITLYYKSIGKLDLVCELFIGYIISCTSVCSGSSSRLPSLLSMCILEALLAPDDCLTTSFSSTSNIQPSETTSTSWFEQYITKQFTTQASSCILKSISNTIHKSIQISKERAKSANAQIRDLAFIELAAFDRICKLEVDTSGWLPDLTRPSEVLDVDTILSLSTCLLLEDDSNNDDSSRNKMQAGLGIACTLTLLTMGDVDRVIQICEKITTDSTKPRPHNNSNLYLLPACCYAYTKLMCQKWDFMKLGNTVGRHTAAAFTVEDKFSPILQSMIQQQLQHTNEGSVLEDWQTIDVITQCCILLGDGCSLQKVVSRVIPNLIQLAGMPQQRRSLPISQRIQTSRMLSSFVNAGEIPTVRVINLKRRPDRLLDFMASAVNVHQLLVVKGPGRLKRAITKNFISMNEEDDEQYYAFDGQSSRDDLEQQLQQRLDGKGTLSDFVKAMWRPSELKAFDRDARDDFELVSTSTSEKACALSHIATWIGIETTLSDVHDSCTTSNDSGRNECKFCYTYCLCANIILLSTHTFILLLIQL